MALTANNLQLTMTEYPLFTQFLGYLILGYVPQEIEEAVDNMDEEDIPKEYNFIARMWWGRNRDPKMRDEIIHYLQQKVKESLP